MKIIKVGGLDASHSRIAQACDRCRSKKIRCDGTQPCCTQCAAVGFECKTSDKLSRRAFPRNYTENLESRVRSMETEIRELKDLIDEKDEKLNIVSELQAQPQSLSSPSEIATYTGSRRTSESPKQYAMDVHISTPSTSVDCQQFASASRSASFLGMLYLMHIGWPY